MRRNKIVVGTTLLVLILLIVIAVSKGSTKELETTNSGPTLEQTLAEQQKAKDYALRQQEIRKAVASYFEKAIRAGDIVGAAVSIVQGDSILISTGFGKRSINSTTKVDGETIFRLGSLSKGFGGVLAASVEAEGKLDFNDKVTDYLPEFQLGDPSNTAKIKIAHILSHSSGAPYHSFTNLVEADLSMAKIAGRFNEVAPQSEPGQQYRFW